MKKFFMFMAAALVTFSLASCDKKDKEKEEPETPKVETLTFQIEVSGITYKSATITVTPSKNDVDYFWNLVAKEALDYYQVDAAGYAELLLESYVEQGYKYADLVGNYLIVSGKDEYEYDLDAETEYVAYAFQISKDLKIEGDVATKAFSTPARQEGEPYDEYESLENLEHNFAEYELSDEYLADYATFDITATDGDYMLYLEINVAEGTTELAAGEYPIDFSGEPNTVTASEGLTSFMGYTFITGSYAGALDGEGYITTPWYLVSGTVKVNANGSIEVNALNSANKTVKSVLTTPVAPKEGGDEAPAKKVAPKRGRSLQSLKAAEALSFKKLALK